MTYSIKLFGPMSRAVGKGELAVACEGSPPTCREIRDRMLGFEPRLAPFLGGCRFAVNGQFAAEDQRLAEHDEIALIGFVSGG